MLVNILWMQSAKAKLWENPRALKKLQGLGGGQKEMEEETRDLRIQAMN